MISNWKEGERLTVYAIAKLREIQNVYRRVGFGG
jgi:hypothetical protein